MRRITTQGSLLVPVVALAVLLAARCGPTPPAGRLAATAGSEDYFTGRQLAYLTFATSEQHPGSVANVVMHMERARVDPSYVAPLGLAGPDAWDSRFAKIADLEDTSDFDMLYLLNAHLGYRGDPVVDPELWQKVEDAILGFKFWYDQPTPAGVIDDMWYWSENHQIIFHTLEYLAGQTFPDRTFATTGMTGAEHREHGRAKILDWIDHTARYGFKEWHSNVYYQKDVTPLLTLVEFADEEEIQTRAAMVLDLVLFDLAMHTYRGAFGATHGRTYKKDKMTALHEDTFNLVKLLFDETEYEFTSTGDSGAFLLARAQRYRLPHVLLEIAKVKIPFVDRERMGLPYDELADLQEPYVHPYGFDLEDEANIALWWSMQNYTTWQGIPLLFDVADRYNLWQTDLFQPFLDLRDAVGGSVEFGQIVAYGFRYAAPLELLKEVNTYTYRTADYMLSTVQDYRKGGRGAQYHAWQATFDANAQVFTTHPGTPSRTFTTWGDDGEPGAWTGTASMPRSAQHENVGLHLYAPQYAVWPDPGSPFYPLTRYELYTHAYFPQDHFDEVTSGGTANWTFGRFRGGYIALYSWRPTAWIQYDPAEVPTNEMILPFELRAEGGADNVWVVECGSLADHGSFEAFQSLFRDDLVAVTPVTTGLPADALPPFFQVVYDSPSQGRISFGWEDPLVVAGAEVPISDYPRYDNPWASVPFFEQNVRIWDPESRTGLEHDHDIPERRVLAELELSAEIDIKPGSDPNSINPKSKGVIPVAVLTTGDFDAVSVDADSVRFGPAEAEKRHKRAHVEDVDGDGDLDLLLHFRIQETGIALGDTEACVIGQTYDGVPIMGCDSIRTVPPK